MARVLGINAVFHDPAAALVVDGETVAAAEEERFSRRKHGKRPVRSPPGSCPSRRSAGAFGAPGSSPRDLDAVAYSYDPACAADRRRHHRRRLGRAADALRAARAAVPAHGAPRAATRASSAGSPHHVAHAASATFASGFDPCCGAGARRARRARLPPGRALRGGELEVLAAQELPHSLGLLYEELTAHLGFRRSSDEYKVMAMASYGEPAFLEELPRAGARRRRRRLPRRADRPRALRARRSRRARSSPPATPTSPATVQRRLEEVLLELARWLHERTGDRDLVLAGGVALNCVANSRLWREGPFERVWVQPAVGRLRHGARARRCTWRTSSATTSAPMRTAALGPRLGRRRARAPRCATAGVAFERPDDIADAVAEVLADNGVVAWFQGRAEFGPRALGHRSLLADPRRPENLEQLNDIKGREQFRPVAPMVLAERAAEIFATGRCRRPYMLFTHGVRHGWARPDPGRRARRRDRPHPDRRPRRRAAGGAHARGFEARTGVPVVSTRRSTPPGGRWSTTRATRSSASARRRSTAGDRPVLVRRTARARRGARRAA